MPPKRKGFSGMLQTPQPLPDERAPAEESPPQRIPSGQFTTRPAKTAPPAATTIRLRQPDAESLQAAWLDERRRNDPKLSYPEFAGMIVRLGLAAHEAQQETG